MRRPRYWRERCREASARLYAQALAVRTQEERADPLTRAALQAVRFQLTDEAFSLERKAKDRGSRGHG